MFVAKLKFDVVEADITTLPSGIKIGWIGLCTEDTITLLKTGGLYAHYKGLQFKNYIATAVQKISWLQDMGVDIIIPLTHISMHQDRELAKQIQKVLQKQTIVPFILGGHDHDVYDEVCEGIRIMKAGMDAVRATVTIITLNPEEKENPNGSGSSQTISKPQRTFTMRSEIVNVASRKVDVAKYRHILDACQKGVSS